MHATRCVNVTWHKLYNPVYVYWRNVGNNKHVCRNRNESDLNSTFKLFSFDFTVLVWRPRKHNRFPSIDFTHETDKSKKKKLFLSFTAANCTMKFHNNRLFEFFSHFYFYSSTPAWTKFKAIRSNTGFGSYSIIIYLFNFVMPVSCFRNRCCGVQIIFYFFTVYLIYTVHNIIFTLRGKIM